MSGKGGQLRLDGDPTRVESRSETDLRRLGLYFWSKP